MISCEIINFINSLVKIIYLQLIMKKLSALLFLLMFTLLIACEKNAAISISNSVSFSVLNVQGQNMLSTSGGFNKDNIFVYYVVDGKAKLYNQPNLTASKGFNLFGGDGNNGVIQVFLNYEMNVPTSLTLVKFGNTKIDTIKSEFSFENNSVHLRKVWFNGELKSNAFTIVK